jgi:hypothetical protein
MKAFDVYLNGRKIDTVFHNDKTYGGKPTTSADVKEGLVNHDGYDPNIVVKGGHKS